MAIFPRISFRSDGLTKQNVFGPTHDFWYNLVGAGTKSGINISESTSIKNITVLSCVTLVCGDIARLPFNLMQKNSDGTRGKVLSHPAHDVVHTSPTSEMSSFNWRESGQAHLMLWGNEYNLKLTDKAGRLRELVIFPDPGKMTVERKNGQVVYTYSDGSETKTFRKQEIFHVPGFGFNGLCGISQIRYARESISLGLAAEELGSKYFSQGMHIAGVLSMAPETGRMGPEEMKEYAKFLKSQYQGLGESHKFLLTGAGEKFTPLSMPMADAQWLEMRGFQKEEICGLFHVPPHKIAKHGANSNYNNLEQENQSYVNSCISHWVGRIEQSANQQLLTLKERANGLYFNLEMKGLLRGDTQARSELYKTLWNMGLPLNRILGLEDMDPVDGGDTGFVQLNVFPLSQATEGNPKADKPVSEKKSFRSLDDSEERSLLREARSLVERDRIIRRHFPRIKNAAQKIVDAEASAVRGQVEKYESSRDAVDEMINWLDSFYNDLRSEIKKDMGPFFRSFMDDISDAAMREIGTEVGEDEISQFVSDYIDTYAKRHTESSQGQLMSLLSGDIEELRQRVDEWEDSRSEKIATNETVRAGNAVYQSVAFAAGMSIIWRTRGKSCPLCNMLNGKIISRGQSYLEPGDEIDPEDGETAPLKSRGRVSHPPLHQNCDCFSSIF